MLAGTHYSASGKFKLPQTVLAAVLFTAAGLLTGLLYGWITYINPLIYLNFLVLAGAAILLTTLIGFARSMAASRNLAVNLTLSFLVCAAAWLAQWSYHMSEVLETELVTWLTRPGSVIDFVFLYADNHTIEISKSGRNGLPITGTFLLICYGIEFLAFMIPIYLLVKGDHYYCEHCEKEYNSATGYVEDTEAFDTSYGAAAPGQYSFLQQHAIRRSLGELTLNPDAKPPIVKVDYHFCKQCGQDSIVHLSSGVLTYDGKKTWETDPSNVKCSGEKTMIKGVYVDAATNKVLSAQFGGGVALPQEEPALVS